MRLSVEIDGGRWGARAVYACVIAFGLVFAGVGVHAWRSESQKHPDAWLPIWP